MKNTGTASLFIIGGSFDQLPAGWSSKADHHAEAIAPGATSGTLAVSASSSATSGGIAGRLTVGSDPASKKE